MDEIGAEKAALRETLRRERRALSEAAVRAASEAVCRRLLALGPVARARAIALYAAMEQELDLAALGAEVRARGAVTVYPRVERARPPTLAFCRIDDLRALAPDRLGIPTPPAGAPRIPLDSVEVAIVPGLAFEPGGHRLGYGRGYYDAALAAAPSALRIGVCHPFQLVDALPRREADEPVDVIVTPDGARATRARPAFLLEGLS